MSQLLIRQALEQHLAALPGGALATAYTSAAFVPAAGVPYQRVALLPAEPDNAMLGTASYFERGVLQITLCYPLGQGPRAAEQMAHALRTHFARGTTLALPDASGMQVLITHTPALAPALLEPDRYCVPVSVRYQAQIF